MPCPRNPAKAKAVTIRNVHTDLSRKQGRKQEGGDNKQGKGRGTLARHDHTKQCARHRRLPAALLLCPLEPAQAGPGSAMQSATTSTHLLFWPAASVPGAAHAVHQEHLTAPRCWAVQADKVWKSMVDKHKGQALQVLNKTLLAKYGCDLSSSDEVVAKVLREGAWGPEGKETVAEVQQRVSSPSKDQRPATSPGVPVSPDASAGRTPSHETEMPTTTGLLKAKGNASPSEMASQLATPPMRPLTKDNDTTSPVIDDAVLEMLVARLEAFYQFVNPDQVDVAEKLVRKFNGNRALLNRALKEKYGVDLNTPSEEVENYLAPDASTMKTAPAPAVACDDTNPEDGVGADLFTGPNAHDKDHAPGDTAASTCSPDLISQDVLGSLDEDLLINEDFHFFQGFEDIKKTEAGISKYLTTPPIHALTTPANTSPLIAPSSQFTPVDEEDIPPVDEDASQPQRCTAASAHASADTPDMVTGSVDFDANPFPQCVTVPEMMRCLCGHVEILFQAPPQFCYVCHCRLCRKVHQAPCVALAAYVESSHLNCISGLESVRYCRPEGGEEQPTLFFCAMCSMMCWKLDKFGLTTVPLVNLRDPESDTLAPDLEPSFHCCLRYSLSILA